jgi:hypothetical protein
MQDMHRTPNGACLGYFSIRVTKQGREVIAIAFSLYYTMSSQQHIEQLGEGFSARPHAQAAQYRYYIDVVNVIYAGHKVWLLA